MAVQLGHCWAVVCLYDRDSLLPSRYQQSLDHGPVLLGLLICILLGDPSHLGQVLVSLLEGSHIIILPTQVPSQKFVILFQFTHSTMAAKS